jgi:tetratricopeptide (TPR) repeat protein
MTPDLYSPCPCGSGKKFKWCCQPIWVGIEHALTQQSHGQQDAALRIIDQVVKEHPGNPEAWGQKARLLYVNGKADEAEEALQKAFDITPNYPFGLLLRAEFRLNEGEVPGALLLLRKAAEAFDPEARDQLGAVYEMLFQCEQRLQRPVAARAALRLVLHYHPENEQARQVFDALFGERGGLPLAARRDYRFLSPPAGGSAARQAVYDRFRHGPTPRLGEVAAAFEELVRQDPQDYASLFNLGLARAWLGNNTGALEALDRYIDLEPDEAAAANAAALEEVLRLGHGMEEFADYHEYTIACQLRESESVNNLLREWMSARRLIPLQTDQSNTFQAAILETHSGALVTVGRPAADTGKLAGHLLIAGGLFQIAGPLKEPIERLKNEIRQRLNIGLGELYERRGPGHFSDVSAEAMIFPLTQPGPDFENKLRESAERFFEDTWIHRPCRSLSGIAPADAVGSPRLRKKVRGIVQFIEECAHGSLPGYDFNRLRRKLNLLPVAPAPGAAPAPATGGTPAAAVGDVSALGAGELSALDVGSLSDEHLETAYQTAHRLSAEDLAKRFATALVARPPRAERPDRYPWFLFLIQKALRDNDTTAALDHVNEGLKQDCEHNEGKRRNDYELRRAQVHVKRGESDEAQDVYQRLIERVPTNLTYRGDAAEAMLRLKQPGKALQFAEAGLEVARRQNDRDNEGRLLDLISAARKQGA